jgi:dTDP-4-amino-4,6-dideoxygalactose transaminase
MSTTPHIYCANPGAEFQEDREDILSLIATTLDRGTYILGGEVDGFEREFANYIGGSYCVGVANGTDAIVYALKGLGIQPGDEVVTVSHTAVATVAAIELLGAVPVFADIDPLTRCMCPTSLSSVLSPKVKAIVVVHIYGQPAQLDKILPIATKMGIPVVEDCAQAHGALLGSQKVGSMGVVSAFSFYPTKNLGALGDGGAIVIRDDSALAERIRIQRQYGWKERYISLVAGGNSRLDELQAAILRYRLTKLDARNARRRAIAALYAEAFAELPITLPTPIEGTKHVMHQYVIESDERDAIKEHLASRGVLAALHYPLAVHQQPAYESRIRGADSLPNTEALYRRLLSLPIYPQLTPENVQVVAKALRSYWGK